MIGAVYNMLNLLKRLLFAKDDFYFSPKIARGERASLTSPQRDQLQQESKIGAGIFGKLPPNVTRRDFFNLDQNNWIWSEEFTLPNGVKKELTTKYEVQDVGILKIQPNQQCAYLDGPELRNFAMAVKEYYDRVVNLYQ